MKAAILSLLIGACVAIASAETLDFPRGELLRLGDGTFIGTSRAGGTDTYGTIFRLSAKTDITVLASFTGDVGLTKGAAPNGGLQLDASGLLWGTTEEGGDQNLGTVFKFSPGARKLTTVFEFGGASGSRPAAALARDGNGNFVGTTRTGGSADLGTIFRINRVTGALTTLVEFTGTSGAFKGSEPRAAVFIDNSGVIWGTTSAGGTGDLGTVFKLDGTTFTTVVEFTGTQGNRLGSDPQAALVFSGGKLWGTTVAGGAANAGTVFSLDPWSLDFAATSFANTNGAKPRGPLTQGATAGTLVGTTELGGVNNLGTVFSVLESTGAITTLSSFSGSGVLGTGAYPFGGLTSDGAGGFVGSTSKGGRSDTGLLFTLDGTTFGDTIDSDPAPGPRPPTVTTPAAATGAPGVPIPLSGAIPNDPAIVTVLVSINDGPFVAATIVPGVNGKPPTWSLNVTPENGTNVVVIKTVNDGDGVSPPKTISFEFTAVRPGIIGTYAGIALPAASGPPLRFSGSLNLTVLPTGRFTGRLVLGGLPAAVSLRGTFANNGTARFGKAGRPLLIIPRLRQTPLSFELELDATTGTLTGTVSENSSAAATIDAAQGLYTAKKNPTAPLINVPTTLLNPLTDKGDYTGVLRALAPTATLPADQFPQGDGFVRLKLSAAGLVRISGRLADGSPITAGGPLVGQDRLPFFTSAYGKLGAVTGELLFRDVPNVTDIDGAALVWIRPATPRAPNYRAGWANGLNVDFEGSKFVSPRATVATSLGNPPSSTLANARITLEAGNLPAPPAIAYDLAIGDTKTAVLGPAPSAGTVSRIAVAVPRSGAVAGTFVHPGTSLATSLSGVVLQKQRTAAGFFLSGSTATGDQKSGRFEILSLP